MRDFDDLIYLDLPKTGSTRITRVLTRNFDRRPTGRAHTPCAHGDTTRLRVISVREPLSLYLSLFRYGCDGRGRLYARLRAAGRAHLYQPDQAGFEAWIGYLLNKEGGRYFGAGYNPAWGIGPMSYRMLRLFWTRADRRLREIRSNETMRRTVMAERLWPHYMIRLEFLEADLKRMLTREGLMRLSPEDFRAACREKGSANAARAGQGISVDQLPEASKAKVRALEWPFYTLFGYGWEAAPPSPRLLPMAYDRRQLNIARKSTVSRVPISAQ